MFVKSLPSWTVGDRGVARLAQIAGVPANTQLGVMQTVCADAGAPTTNAVAATTRSLRMDVGDRSMAVLLRDRRNFT